MEIIAEVHLQLFDLAISRTSVALTANTTLVSANIIAAIPDMGVVNLFHDQFPMRVINQGVRNHTSPQSGGVL